MRKNEAIWIEKSKRWQIKVQKDGVRRAFYSPDPKKRGKAEAERKADRWLETGSRKEAARIGALAKEFAEYESAMYGTGNNRQHESIYRNWIAPKYEHKKAARLTQQDWKNIIKDCLHRWEKQKDLEKHTGIHHLVLRVHGRLRRADKIPQKAKDTRRCAGARKEHLAAVAVANPVHRGHSNHSREGWPVFPYLRLSFSRRLWIPARRNVRVAENGPQKDIPEIHQQH